MKMFLLTLSILLCTFFSTYAQNFIFSKTFTLDSSFGTPWDKIFITSDNNLLLTGCYQNSYYNGTMSLLAIKAKSNGEVIWQKTIQRQDIASLYDAFENDGNYYLASYARIYIGKYQNIVLSVSSFDKDGNLLFDNFDTTKKSIPYNVGLVRKFNNRLISFSMASIANYYILGWLDYDLEGKFLDKTDIDTLNLPNLFEIFNSNISILNDNTVGFSFGTIYKDNTSPIWYYIYDSTKIIKKRYSINISEQMATPSLAGPFYKTKNGNYILTGRIHNYNLDYFSFVRMIDTVGNIIWEDTLKGVYSFYKIIQDDFGNILIAGSQFNKMDTDNIHTLSFFYVGGYTQNGKQFFNYLWGDSTKEQYLDDAILKNNGDCFVIGGVNNVPYLAEITYNPDKVIDNRQLLKEPDIKISPNPVNDYLFIDSREATNAQQIQIYTIEGIKVLQSDYNQKIDVSRLIPGFYILRIGNRHQKFIKF